MEKIKELFFNLIQFIWNYLLALPEKKQIIIIVSLGIILTIIVLYIAVKIDKFIYYHTK